MALSAKDVRWVAHLARLELTDAELETMTRQLGAILDYVDSLKQVNTDGVEPMAHAVRFCSVIGPRGPRPLMPS